MSDICSVSREGLSSVVTFGLLLGVFQLLNNDDLVSMEVIAHLLAHSIAAVVTSLAETYTFILYYF